MRVAFLFFLFGKSWCIGRQNLSFLFPTRSLVTLSFLVLKTGELLASSLGQRCCNIG